MRFCVFYCQTNQQTSTCTAIWPDNSNVAPIWRFSPTSKRSQANECHSLATFLCASTFNFQHLCLYPLSQSERMTFSGLQQYITENGVPEDYNNDSVAPQKNSLLTL